MRADCGIMAKPHPTAHPRDRGELRILFPNSFLEVRDALRRALANIGCYGLSQDETGNIEIVLSEVLNNVVEHAYAALPCGLIELRLLIGTDCVCCTVLDDGHPFPAAMLPLGDRADPPLIHTYPEGGYGWFLIKEIACDLEYCRLKDRNCLSFRIPVASQLRSN